MGNRKEIIKDIQYYWEEWRDIYKIEDIIRTNEQEENFSKLIFAIGQVKIWRDMVDKAVEELNEEHLPCENCDDYLGPCNGGFSCPGAY